MKEFRLLAISPVDGRYAGKVVELQAFFSEFALIKYRIFVEIEYFIALCNFLDELSGFNKKDFPVLRKIHEEFSLQDAMRIKEIETITNHDVKAVEYFLKEKFEQHNWKSFKEYIHFGLTSQDINNTAVPLLLKDFTFQFYMPTLTNIINELESRAREWQLVPMLARTHGQPASPTLLGKEIMVFVERLNEQLRQLSHLPFKAKFGGATGNFNAHFAAFPDSDWINFANNLLKKFGLERQQYTTQIEHYDNLSSLFDNLKRINTILIDFCRDVWLYISFDYFTQKIVSSEVGSSAMPHKVNPIDFENAEGNLGAANAMFNFLSEKLPVSRLQRDLTDSTVSRNIGVPLAHTIIAFKSIEKGLSRLQLNAEKIKQDLENNWIVVSEAIQTVLRKAGYPHPYEALKSLTRKHQKPGKAELHQFIDSLDIDDELKAYLKSITPFNYTGKIIDFSER
ncbi:MAG TPA: adenylosuccinate lyase [Bacteroidia bacterium]|nr:adenylosuccinate lyase [Bacteroidia bacterium]HRS58775.1 adenylosuccinate lyase [Bacteroidia bacterium]